MPTQYTESFVDNSEGKHLHIKAEEEVIMRIIHLLQGLATLTDRQKSVLASIAMDDTMVTWKCEDPSKTDYSPYPLLADFGLICFKGVLSRVVLTNFGHLYCALNSDIGKKDQTFIDEHFSRTCWLDWKSLSSTEIKIFFMDKTPSEKPMTRAQAFHEMFSPLHIDTDVLYHDKPTITPQEILQARVDAMTENMLAATSDLFTGLPEETKDTLTLAVISERLSLPYEDVLTAYRFLLKQRPGNRLVQPLPFLFNDLAARGLVDLEYARNRNFEERPKLTKLAEMYYYGLEDVHAGSLSPRLVARHLTAYCKLKLSGAPHREYPYSVKNLSSLEAWDPLTDRWTGSGWNICRALDLKIVA